MVEEDREMPSVASEGGLTFNPVKPKYRKTLELVDLSDVVVGSLWSRNKRVFKLITFKFLGTFCNIATLALGGSRIYVFLLTLSE